MFWEEGVLHSWKYSRQFSAEIVVGSVNYAEARLS